MAKNDTAQRMCKPSNLPQKTWQADQFSADVYCKIIQALLQIFIKNPTKLNKQGKLLSHNSADAQVHRNLKMDTS